MPAATIPHHRPAMMTAISTASTNALFVPGCPVGMTVGPTSQAQAGPPITATRVRPVGLWRVPAMAESMYVPHPARDDPSGSTCPRSDRMTDEPRECETEEIERVETVSEPVPRPVAPLEVSAAEEANSVGDHSPASGRRDGRRPESRRTVDDGRHADSTVTKRVATHCCRDETRNQALRRRQAQERPLAVPPPFLALGSATRSPCPPCRRRRPPRDE